MRPTVLSNQTGAFQTPALREITARVQAVGGINLGQGVCNLPVPEFLVEAAARAMQDGINRYTDPRGLESLRTAIATKVARDNGMNADPKRNVLATCGATGAFEAVCGTLLNPGDRVVVFEPYYPYHLQALRRYGAEVLRVPLVEPAWEFSPADLRHALATNPKFVLVNTPHNPTGKVWSEAEIDLLADLLEGSDTLVVTDEIYEYMVFDGRRHLSPASHPRLRDRTITIGGFSKTFAITGWRIGYLIAPDPLVDPLIRFLDAVYVCPPAPLQQAVAEGIERLGSDYFGSLAAKYQSKRDLFLGGMREIGFDPLNAEGAYYMLARYEGVLKSTHSNEAADELIGRCGIGAVPSSDFVADPHRHPWLRLCLAHEDHVLLSAIDRLGSLR